MSTTLSIVSGTANEPLAAATAHALRAPLLRRTLRRFPDGEVELHLDESVRGHDVYLVQPTSPPVDATLMELLFLADACRRAGARRVTAVVPYFGYARQDRRAHGREPLGARLAADLFAAAGIGRLVALDLHSAAIEGDFAFPVEHLTAVPLLARALRELVDPRSVLVAPDLGAVKLAERYARLLELPVAIVHKERLSGHEVVARRLIGDVAGRSPILVDDMIATGATIEAALGAVRAAGSRAAAVVATSHLLLVGDAARRLGRAGPLRLVATDSVHAPAAAALDVQVASVAPLLGQAIFALHHERPLGELAPLW